MKFLIIGLLCVLLTSCVSKPICQNQTENLRSVYDVENKCKVRIRQVVIGSEIDIPKSIGFKSETVWTYSWKDSKFENGKINNGHFVLMPLISKDKAEVESGN